MRLVEIRNKYNAFLNLDDLKLLVFLLIDKSNSNSKLSNYISIEPERL